MSAGRLLVIGLGPGDPELMTLKAARLLAAAAVIAVFAKKGNPGQALTIARPLLAPSARLLRLDYPSTIEIPVTDPGYLPAMAAFYDWAAGQIALELAQGHDVALLCEGDPFLYGSAMYVFDRLRDRHPVEVVPGVTGMSGCWSAAGLPFTHGDDLLAVLPATLDEGRLTTALELCDAAVFMKVGRNLAKIGRVLEAVGRMDRAVYVERGTMADQRICPLREMLGQAAPYFSIVLVPGRQRPR